MAPRVTPSTSLNVSQMPGLSAPQTAPQRSATADQLSQAGVGLMRAGVGISSAAARAQDEYDEGRVVELENKFADGLYTALRGDKGFLNRRGGDAAKPEVRDQFVQGLDKAVESFVEQADSDAQREALKRRLQSRARQAREAIDTHYQRESTAYAIGQETARVERGAQDYAAAFDPTNPEAAREEYGRVAASVRRIGELRGDDPKTTQLRLDKVTTEMHASVLDKLLDDGDPDTARTYMAQNEKSILPEARAKFTRVIDEAASRKKGTDLAIQFESEGLSPLDQLERLDSMRAKPAQGDGPAAPGLSDQDYKRALSAILERQQAKAELAARERITFSASIQKRLDENRLQAQGGAPGQPGVAAKLLDAESLMTPAEVDRARELGVLDNLRAYSANGRFGDAPGGREFAQRLIEDGMMRELSWEQIYDRVRPWVSDSTMGDLFQGWNKARGTHTQNPGAKFQWESDSAFKNTELERLLKFLPQSVQDGRFTKDERAKWAYDFRRDQAITTINDRLTELRKTDTTTPEKDLVRQIISSLVEERLQVVGGGAPSNRVNAQGETLFMFTEAETVNDFQVVADGVAVPLSELGDPAVLNNARAHALAYAESKRAEAAKWPEGSEQYQREIARANRAALAADQKTPNMRVLAEVLARVRAAEGAKRASDAPGVAEDLSYVKKVEDAFFADERREVARMIQAGASFADTSAFVFENRYGMRPEQDPHAAEKLRLIRQDLWASFPDPSIFRKVYEFGKSDTPNYRAPVPTLDAQGRFWVSEPVTPEERRRREQAAERNIRWR